MPPQRPFAVLAKFAALASFPVSGLKALPLHSQWTPTGGGGCGGTPGGINLAQDSDTLSFLLGWMVLEAVSGVAPEGGWRVIWRQRLPMNPVPVLPRKVSTRVSDGIGVKCTHRGAVGGTAGGRCAPRMPTLSQRWFLGQQKHRRSGGGFRPQWLVVVGQARRG